MTGPVPARPLPGCPARQGNSAFTVAAADFLLDVRDRPGRYGSGATVTEVTGYFRPPAARDGTGPGTDAAARADTDADPEPDLVTIAVLDLPAGTPGAQAAWQAYQNPAGPAAISQAMRAAIAACPCLYPAADCAALNADVLRQAIEQAAALRTNGQQGQ